MRSLLLALLLACSSKPAPIAKPHDDGSAKPSDDTGEAKLGTSTVAQKDKLTTDTPRTTVAGNTFIAPAGW